MSIRSLPMRVPSEREKAMAQEIMDGLPRPIWLKGGGKQPGPGMLKISEWGAPGWNTLKGIAAGVVSRGATLEAMSEAHKRMLGERIAPPSAPAVPLGIIDRLDSISARQVELGECFEELSAKIDQLLKVWT